MPCAGLTCALFDGALHVHVHHSSDARGGPCTHLAKHAFSALFEGVSGAHNDSPLVCGVLIDFIIIIIYIQVSSETNRTFRGVFRDSPKRPFKG